MSRDWASTVSKQIAEWKPYLAVAEDDLFNKRAGGCAVPRVPL